MEITLTPELEKLVNEEIESGRYKSASEVVREGLRLLEARRLKLEALRRDIQEGIDQADRGELVSADEVFAEMRKKAEAMK